MILCVVLTLGLGYGTRQIRVDFSFDSFNPPDEEEFIRFNAFRDTFGYADNTVQVAFKNGGKSVFERDFLLRVDSVMTQIVGLNHVDSVIRPSTLAMPERVPGSFEGKLRPIFDLSSQEGVLEGKQGMEQDTLLMSVMVSRDQQYFASIAVLDPAILDSSLRDTLSVKILGILDQCGLEHVVSGIPIIRTQYVQRITSELFVFLGLSIVLIITILFLTYRSFWGVWVPLLGVLMALVWSMGFMGWIGTPVDLMSELLPPIIFVVGMSDIIHMVTKYVAELKKGLEKHEAMRITLKEIGMATLLTSVTTAIGFASLLVSRMPPLKSFGIYAAASVLFAYIIAIILIPTVLLSLNPDRLTKTRGVGNLHVLDHLLRGAHRLIRQRPRAIGLGFVVLSTVSVIGMSQISFNTYLLDDISKNDPIQQSLTFFEQEFYGMRPFEIEVMAKDTHTVTDLPVLQAMDQIQAYLRKETRISPFFSPVTVVKAANRTAHYSRQKYWKLPDSQDEVDEYVGLISAFGGDQALRQVVSKDGKLARMSARMTDVGTDSFGILRLKLDDFIAAHCDTSYFDYHLTGSAILNETNVTHLRTSLFSGLILAFVLIGALMGLLFKSWKMLLAGIIVNVIPLLVTAGVMGFAGITLKASTSIIFLIAFGIAVDDTIHFLSRLRLELSLGKTMEQAIDESIAGTGKAMILTSLVLFCGFIILLISDFGGTFSIGLFTALTLATALLSDLLLLPVMVRWLYGIGKHKPAE